VSRSRDTIACGVAALGNTYGGLLLVGVTDDRIVRGVKEKTIETVADHCAAKIEPPWVPDRDEGGVQLLVRGVQEPGVEAGEDPVRIAVT